MGGWKRRRGSPTKSSRVGRVAGDSPSSKNKMGNEDRRRRSERLPSCIDIDTWSKDRSGWPAGILDGDHLTLKTD